MDKQIDWRHLVTKNSKQKKSFYENQCAIGFYVSLWMLIE